MITAHHLLMFLDHCRLVSTSSASNMAMWNKMKFSVCLILFLTCSSRMVSATRNHVQMAGQCSIDSAGTVFKQEVEPWIFKTFDELDALSSNLLDKITEGIDKLEPHVASSPMPDFNRTEHFTSLKNNVKVYLYQVYREIGGNYEELQRLSEDHEVALRNLNPIEGCGEHNELFSDLYEKVKKIEKSHHSCTAILINVLQELSITTRAVVINSISLIMDSLKIDGLDKENASRLLTNNVDRVAPNFFGILMKKILTKGSSRKNYKKINKNVLSVLEDIHIKMLTDLSELSSVSYPCSALPKLLDYFWKSQTAASIMRLKGVPDFGENHATMYSKDIFLSEVAASLMASFGYDEEE